jgi:hypothetical protein
VPTDFLIGPTPLGIAITAAGAVIKLSGSLGATAIALAGVPAASLPGSPLGASITTAAASLLAQVLAAIATSPIIAYADQTAFLDETDTGIEDAGSMFAIAGFVGGGSNIAGVGIEAFAFDFSVTPAASIVTDRYARRIYGRSGSKQITGRP